MNSLKARVICFTLKHRNALQVFHKRKAIDWTTPEAVQDFRKQVEKTTRRFGSLPAGIEVTPVTIDQIPAEWIQPEQSAKDEVILYFHGGGYVSGTCATHRSHVAKVVKGTSLPALLFEYRLAPEHPYPAALEDALTAYRWLTTQDVPPHRIVFAGDSAGGGLCLATLLALRDQGIPLPSAAAVLSPVTDCTCRGESHQRNAKKCLAPEGTAPAFCSLYAGRHNPDTPYISPLFGDLTGLPPLFISVGGNETLLDDSLRFAQKAQRAGVQVTLRVGEGLFHCFPVTAPLFPEATQAMNEICRFITTHAKTGQGEAHDQ